MSDILENTAPRDDRAAMMYWHGRWEAANDAALRAEENFRGQCRMTAQVEAAKNSAYSERDQLVAALAKLALRVGGDAWVGKHDAADESWDPEWRNIVYVRFPETGQLSWHIHDSELSWFASIRRSDVESWDGHSTEEKYERLARLEAER